MKSILVLLIASFAILVALNNITDYQSNFSFVQHVLMMDTTFEGNSLLWRALNQPLIHHIAYACIIALEAAVGLICLIGSINMYRSSKQSYEQHYQAVILSSWGLVIGLILWFGGFMVVGAEWFLMWQSDNWNGQPAAFRFTTSLFACLIFIHLPEPRNNG